MLIFAYGSNMCSTRLRRRVSSAVARGIAALEGYQLRFHKRSHDGSAKADAVRTGDPLHRVWGVVFQIDPAQKADLDAAEGLGNGYSEAIVTTRLEANETPVQVYLANSSSIAAELRPYTWYMRYVVAGALEHGLPADYVETLRGVPAINDPDLKRHSKEWLRLPGELVLLGPQQTPIRSVEEWFTEAPPKKGAAHWVEGRSAMELARAWFRMGIAAQPEELTNLLATKRETAGFEVTLGLPEHSTSFDGYGTGRNHDLLLVLRRQDEIVVAGVEAKAGEPLDAALVTKYEGARKMLAAGEPTKLPDRIDDLMKALFGRSLDDEPRLGQVRYQLLTAAAGTLVEARKRNATAAVLVVHDFAPQGDGISQTQLALSDFMNALTRDESLHTAADVLHGPYLVPGGGRIPNGIPLYVALIRPRARAERTM